jgi:hypothetical protein
MADEASLTNGARMRTSSPIEGVFDNLVEFSGNLVTLGELQAKLAAYELRNCVQQATWPVAMIVVACVIALGSIPVILFGVAEWLVRAAAISHASALLLTGFGALIVAGILAGAATPLLRRSFDRLQHTRDEFTRNINWIKTVLTHSGRSSARGS